MKNSLAAMHPEIADEWSEKNLPLTPDTVTYGSNRQVWWKGACGHEWKASIKSRSSGENCPICSGKRVVEGINDLATLEPELALEWSDKNEILKPTMVGTGSHKKIIWKGKCGHEWTASVKNRVKGSGCPYCSGNILLKGFNDFATKQPELALEWSERNLSLTPDMINDKARKNVWWKCRKCGYEWKAVVFSRVKGAGCPVCADRAVLSGYNDLATTDPNLLAQWDYDKNTDVSPEHISRSSMRKVWWKCGFGHSWRGKISEKAIEGKGCRECEKEYQSVFPQLAVSYYAAQKGLKVLLNSDAIIGIPMEIYIPEEKVAVESFAGTQEIDSLKEYLCRQRGIKFIKILYRANDSEIDFAINIKKLFRSIHIFISSDVNDDVTFIRKRFNEWRKNK